MLGLVGGFEHSDGCIRSDPSQPLEGILSVEERTNRTYNLARSFPVVPAVCGTSTYLIYLSLTSVAQVLLFHFGLSRLVELEQIIFRTRALISWPRHCLTLPIPRLWYSTAIVGLLHPAVAELLLFNCLGSLSLLFRPPFQNLGRSSYSCYTQSLTRSWFLAR
jgi:hypothetical protein